MAQRSTTDMSVAALHLLLLGWSCVVSLISGGSGTILFNPCRMWVGHFDKYQAVSLQIVLWWLPFGFC